MSRHLAKVTEIIKSDALALARELGGRLASLESSTVLVTGAGGFLCSFVLDVLAALNDQVFKSPCHVVALDNFLSGVPERIEHLESRPDFSFVKHDLRQEFRPPRPLDYIIHGASVASPPFYRKFPLETIDVNINGTRCVLELSRNVVRSLVHLSTSEVYGDPAPECVPTREAYVGSVSFTGPRACYDESKRLSETLCSTFFRLYSLPVKVARPFNVYGPGQRIDDGRIIPDLIRAALNQEPLVLYSNGRATRSFCYIKDAVKAILLLLVSSQNGESFNIGSDREEITMAEVAELVKRAAGPTCQEVSYQSSQDPAYLTDNPQRRCPDLTKLRAATGYEPEISLEEGLARTLASYRLLISEPAFSENA